MITASIEMITPKIAEKYLQSNTDNYRALNKSRMISYASDMIAGLWQVNGEPIVFDEDGVLKDGQTRLNAIAYSGASVPMMVVRGVSKDVRIFDIGGGRTEVQIAKSEGVLSNTSIIGAVNILACRQKAIATPKAFVLKYIREWAELLNEAYSISCIGANHPIGKKSAIILAIYVFLRLNILTSNDLHVFFRVFNSQNPIGFDNEVSPVFVALKQVQAITKNGRPQQIMQSEIIAQALLDFKNGKQRTKAYRTDANIFPGLLNKVCDMDGITRYESK